MTNLTAYILLSLSFLFLFFLGEILLKYFKVAPEYSRKFVHITSGILACAFPFCFNSHWWVMGICFSFLLLLYLSKTFNFLKGINSVERKTYGSILYPIAIYLCFILNQLLEKYPGQYPFYFSSVLIMAISDPLAALIGRKYPLHRFMKIVNGKSIGGSLAFFISALIISFSFLNIDNKIFICLTISLLSTIVELFCSKGFDNIFVPLSCYLVFFLIIYNQ
jgi:phytol kinase